MKLTEHVYMLSGVPYSTNSNSYAILAGERLLLIDAGYSVFQWQVMGRVMKDWGIDRYPISHLFLTHVHFDHAGNAHRVKRMGGKICVSEADGISLREGNRNTLREMTEAFPDPFIPCEPDVLLRPGDRLDFDGVQLQVIEGRGHSAGALLYLVTVDSRRILFTGDCITIGPDDAKDNVLVDLAWCGGPDADIEEYGKTLKRAAALDVDILAPGHYHPYFGGTGKLFEAATALFEKTYHS